jgi:hypothetical protein
MRKEIIETLKSHAIGHINKHKMNVEIYLANPVGIGEHSDVIETIELELKQIAEYQDQLEVLEKYFS